MNIRKYVSLILLGLAIVLPLSGCGGGGGETDSPVSENSTGGQNSGGGSNTSSIVGTWACNCNWYNTGADNATGSCSSQLTFNSDKTYTEDNGIWRYDIGNYTMAFNGSGIWASSGSGYLLTQHIFNGETDLQTYPFTVSNNTLTMSINGDVGNGITNHINTTCTGGGSTSPANNSIGSSTTTNSTTTTTSSAAGTSTTNSSFTTTTGWPAYTTTTNSYVTTTTLNNSNTPSSGIYGTVTSKTGRVWMDRNLGASRVATSLTDSAAYGDLYQWGRGADGHQRRTSRTTSIRSSTNDPGHGAFITPPDAWIDWLNPPHNALWNTAIGNINNPCPSGFRVPTQEEWTVEKRSWSSSGSSGAWDSPLKLVLGGGRAGKDGQLFQVGTDGFYWSSSGYADPDMHSYSWRMRISEWVMFEARQHGFSVRCIQD
ncbi:MAG: hypothetical protein KJ950_08105 [Proteobacteria bacterium]|nr:hypothetical protein [Pseudomonadota bacterium]MBU1686455.1 hypothetical protein [Pseudomonadota bacterium]